MTELSMQARKIIKDENICGGVPILEGTRIRVSDVALAYDFQGMTAEEIAEELSLEVSDIFSALTYYSENLEEIRREIQERKRCLQKNSSFCLFNS